MVERDADNVKVQRSILCSSIQRKLLFAAPESAQRFNRCKGWKLQENTFYNFPPRTSVHCTVHHAHFYSGLQWQRGQHEWPARGLPPARNSTMALSMAAPQLTRACQLPYCDCLRALQTLISLLANKLVCIQAGTFAPSGWMQGLLDSPLGPKFGGCLGGKYFP